jgi:pimeloyl-ACP methyl ester carboxylesterase
VLSEHLCQKLCDKTDVDITVDYQTHMPTTTACTKLAIAVADIDEYMRGYGAPDGMRPGFEPVRALPVDVENNRVAMAHRIDLPVLAVGGDRSLGTRVAENLAHLASNVQSVVVENCAHFVPEEQPAKTAELILRFLAESP